jgi:hypothetical protein
MRFQAQFMPKTAPSTKFFLERDFAATVRMSAQEPIPGPILGADPYTEDAEKHLNPA